MYEIQIKQSVLFADSVNIVVRSEYKNHMIYKKETTVNILYSIIMQWIGQIASQSVKLSIKIACRPCTRQVTGFNLICNE